MRIEEWNRVIHIFIIILFGICGWLSSKLFKRSLLNYFERNYSKKITTNQYIDAEITDEDSNVPETDLLKRSREERRLRRLQREMLLERGEDGRLKRRDRRSREERRRLRENEIMGRVVLTNINGNNGSNAPQPREEKPIIKNNIMYESQGITSYTEKYDVESFKNNMVYESQGIIAYPPKEEIIQKNNEDYYQQYPLYNEEKYNVPHKIGSPNGSEVTESSTEAPKPPTIDIHIIPPQGISSTASSPAISTRDIRMEPPAPSISSSGLSSPTCIGNSIPLMEAPAPVDITSESSTPKSASPIDPNIELRYNFMLAQVNGNDDQQKILRKVIKQYRDILVLELRDTSILNGQDIRLLESKSEVELQLQRNGIRLWDDTINSSTAPSFHLDNEAGGKHSQEALQWAYEQLHNLNGYNRWSERDQQYVPQSWDENNYGMGASAESSDNVINLQDAVHGAAPSTGALPYPGTAQTEIQHNNTQSVPYNATPEALQAQFAQQIKLVQEGWDPTETTQQTFSTPRPYGVSHTEQQQPSNGWDPTKTTQRCMSQNVHCWNNITHHNGKVPYYDNNTMGSLQHDAAQQQFARAYAQQQIHQQQQQWSQQGQQIPMPYQQYHQSEWNATTYPPKKDSISEAGGLLAGQWHNGMYVPRKKVPYGSVHEGELLFSSA